jgi:hypothetical protein
MDPSHVPGHELMPERNAIEKARMSEKKPDRMLERMSSRMSAWRPKRISECMPERMSSIYAG